MKLDPRLIIAAILIIGAAVFAAFAERLGISATGVGGVSSAVALVCTMLGYGTPNGEHRALRSAQRIREASRKE